MSSEREPPKINLASVRTDITKEEAARRQIDRAVLMVLENDDAICTHVLAASAAEIVADVCKQLGLPSSRDSMQRVVRPEKLAEFRRLHKKAYNYFKHADDDHDQQLPFFNGDATNILLLLAMTDYRAAFQRTTAKMLAYSYWMMALYPHMFTVPDAYADYIELAQDLRNATPDEQRRIGLATLQAIERQAKENPAILQRPAPNDTA